MKIRILQLLALCSLAVLAGNADEYPDVFNRQSSALKERFSKPDDERKVSRMRNQASEISRRVGMSAPLDAAETTDPATGIDAIQEMHKSGYIIPATLEEVEAALHAAAQTPGIEDDSKALILRHRGSYRFFLKD